MAEDASAELALLIREVQDGVARSESALYERFSTKVYYVALHGSRSPQDAEDVRSETFLRVLQAIRGGQIRSAQALPAFILGVARNVLHELYARRRRSGEAVPADTADLSVSSHEQGFVDRDVQRAIQATINRLRPRERAVLRLHFYEELPTPEIARRLGIAPERVRLVKSRALKHFRDIYRTLRTR